MSHPRGSQQNPMTNAERDAAIDQSVKPDNTPDADIGEITHIDRTPAGMIRMRSRNYRGELVTTEAPTAAECRTKHRAELNKAYPKNGHVDY